LLKRLKYKVMSLTNLGGPWGWEMLKLTRFLDSRLTVRGETFSLTLDIPEYSWYSFLLEVECTVGLEELGQLENSLTSLGIEPATACSVVMKSSTLLFYNFLG
jgi:hypothetical protein